MLIEQQFNKLAGTTVTRDSLEELLTKAQASNNKVVASRVDAVLVKFPHAQEFTLNIKDPIPTSIGVPDISQLTKEEKNGEVYFFVDGKKVAEINKNGALQWITKRGLGTKIIAKIRKKAHQGIGNPETIDQDILSGLEFIENDEFLGLGKSVSPNEIYDYITALIINTVKTVGHLPWQKEWTGSGSENQAKNFVTKKPYSGANFFLLNFDIKEDENGELYLVPIKFVQPYYLTFTQIKEAKASLKKGSEARRVIYYTMIFGYDDGTIKIKTSDKNVFSQFVKDNNLSNEQIEKNGSTLPVIKYYNVYRADDCTGLTFPEKTKPKKTTPIQEAQSIIDGYPNPPKFTFVGDGAHYIPSKDVVNMPNIKAFSKEEFYYSTYFHEIIHSTGHSKRLNRGNDTRKRDGSIEDKKAYAFEELVAELGAVFLCSESGILFTTRENSAKYLHGWNRTLISFLEDDNRFFLKASAQSQKAANWILDKIDADKKPTKTAAKKAVVVTKPLKSVTKNPRTVKNAPKIDKRKYPLSIIYNDFPPGTKVRIRKIYLDAGKIGVVKLHGYDPYMRVFEYPFHTKIEYQDGTDEWVKPSSYEVIKPSKVKITQKKTVKLTVKSSKKPITTKKASNILMLQLNKINTDTARFQNRNKLNETVLNQIIENYSETKLDPIIVWNDPNGKTFLLAGHHRFEAVKRLGKKEIPAKYFTGTEAAAIKYAKVESNANRSLELPQERAKIYRQMIQDGNTKKAVNEEAIKLEGKNANYILNLSYLNPKGIVLSSLDALSETTDKQNATLIEKIADWIGEARRSNNNITNAHEKEIFDFLQDKEASKRITTKSEFLQKIHSVTGGFDFDSSEPLNLKRFKYETQGEQVYNAESKELKAKLDELLDKRLKLNDRFKNPNNPGYINPNSKDFDVSIKIYDKSILKINEEIKIYQQKIIDLQRRKGEYTNAGSDQGSLFSPIFPIVPNVKFSELENPEVIEKPGIQPKLIKSKLMEMNFETLPMRDGWEKFMQHPAKNLKIGLFGKPKNGKTAGSLQLANYLTNFGNVLYNFADQGFNLSTQILWKESGLHNKPNAEPSDVNTLDELEKEIKTGKYQFVFIDMINDYIDREKISPQEFKDRFVLKYPSTGFILVFESTKAGDFKGDQKWMYVVDAIANVEDFVMTIRGRYGNGDHLIWEKGLKDVNPKRYEEYMAKQEEENENIQFSTEIETI